MSLLEICQWIESTPSSTALRESLWVFPIIETTHVLGLAFSVGTIFWFDLRLLGAGMSRYTISETFGYVRPWMFAGFAVMMLTGVVLFWTHAVQAYGSGYFRVKLLLLLLAGPDKASASSIVSDFNSDGFPDIATVIREPHPQIRVTLSGSSQLIVLHINEY